MTEFITFRLFRTCLIVCACMALGAIWFGEHFLPPAYFQTMMSIFVIGLASFLIWFSSVLLSIRALIKAQ